MEKSILIAPIAFAASGPLFSVAYNHGGHCRIINDRKSPWPAWVERRSRFAEIWTQHPLWAQNPLEMFGSGSIHARTNAGVWLILALWDRLLYVHSPQ